MIKSKDITNSTGVTLDEFVAYVVRTTGLDRHDPARFAGATPMGLLIGEVDGIDHLTLAERKFRTRTWAVGSPNFEREVEFLSAVLDALGERLPA
jgi:hypothetical protein